jgi:hypothetical protein
MTPESRDCGKYKLVPSNILRVNNILNPFKHLELAEYLNLGQHFIMKFIYFTTLTGLIAAAAAETASVTLYNRQGTSKAAITVTLGVCRELFFTSAITMRVRRVLKPEHEY